MKPRKPVQRKVTVVRALSKLGYCSRTQAIHHVEEGRVKVNGNIVRDPLLRCSLEYDRIALEGRPVEQASFVYIILNKPAGVVTTRSDERGARTVYDVLGDVGTWVFPVGRLDKETTGLLLMTNNHRLGEQLTNPDSHIPKTYIVKVDKSARADDIRLFERGITLRGEKLRPARVRLIEEHRYEVTIYEGKNRQIRKMFEQLGYRIITLRRISMGSLSLGSLGEGCWRRLKKQEIRQLCSL